MKKTATRIVFFMAWLCIAPMALASDGYKPWPIEKITTHTQCPWRAVGPNAHIMTSDRQWQRLMSVSPERGAGQAIDWQHHDALVFGVGTQANLAIGLNIEPNALGFEGRNARLRVTILRPEKGEMAPMALSHPCAVLLIPKRTWRVLDVFDIQEAKTLWRGRLKTP
jgi:hypothetical protein